MCGSFWQIDQYPSIKWKFFPLDYLIFESIDSVFIELVIHAFFHHFFEIFVGVGLIMLEHEKSGQVCRNSIDRQICSFDSMVEVIVFATPTVKAIGEPIDGLVVFPGERSNTTYVVEVLEAILPLVNCYRHMFRTIAGAFVNVPVIKMICR